MEIAYEIVRQKGPYHVACSSKSPQLTSPLLSKSTKAMDQQKCRCICTWRISPKLLWDGCKIVCQEALLKDLFQTLKICAADVTNVLQGYGPSRQGLNNTMMEILLY